MLDASETDPDKIGCGGDETRNPGTHHSSVELPAEEMGKILLYIGF